MKPKPLRIAHLEMSPPVVLAPMSSLTTLPMRTISEEYGCGFTVTEFLPAQALSARNKNILQRLTPSSENRPFGVQIYGRDPDQMKRAAEIAVEYGADLVDINMGCPTRKVNSGSCGAALMREPRLAAEIVRAVCQGAGNVIPVTVKMRTGWDAHQINAPEFAQQMVEAGAQAITVHGRTRAQRYEDTVNLEVIAEVKQSVPIPVLANGDIVDIPSLERTFAVTGADGVMIGRAALGNPWIFRNVLAWWNGEPEPTPPNEQDCLAVFQRHLELHLALAPERQVIFEMRKFARWYLQGFPRLETLLPRYFRLETLAEVRALLDADCLHQPI